MLGNARLPSIKAILYGDNIGYIWDWAFSTSYNRQSYTHGDGSLVGGYTLWLHGYLAILLSPLPTSFFLFDNKTFYPLHENFPEESTNTIVKIHLEYIVQSLSPVRLFATP